MKYNLYVHQVKAIELGIKNINQALIFDLLTSASTWAETEIVNNEVYYWVARQKICNELSILDMKPDTVYRHLKTLNELAVIDYIKVGKKDCIRVTRKGKQYLLKDDVSHYVGNKSELDENSEINPEKLGNKSENDSEINPTYNTTNTNPTTNIINKPKNENSKVFFEWLVEDIKQSVLRKSKVGFTVKGFEAYKLIEDKSRIKENYIAHQMAKGEFAQTIANFLTDYKANTKPANTPKTNLDLGDKKYTEGNF